MSWYIDALKKYVVFEGRSRRKAYWMFALFNFIFYAIAALIDALIHTRILSILYDLAVLLPGLAILARRLHDTNRSAWWILIGLIPVIGGIILLVYTLLPSQAGENKYGPKPDLS